MATQVRDPGSPSRSAGGKPGLLLDGYVIVDQSNRSETFRSIQRKSTMAALAVTALLSGAPGLAVAQSPQTDGSVAARAGAIAHAQKDAAAFPRYWRRRSRDTACDSTAGDRPGPGWRYRDLPTERPYDNIEKCLLPESRNQWTRMRHLS